MALNLSKTDAVALLSRGPRGVREWNRRRSEPGDGLVGLKQLVDHYSETPDLRGANLDGLDLSEIDLAGALLCKASLRETNLSGAKLQNSNLATASLIGASLFGSNLTGADLTDATLRGSDLGAAIFRGTHLVGADFEGARLAGTVLASDLSGARGLESTYHYAPSYLDIGSLVTMSPLPEEFLRGCGLRQQEVEYFKSLGAVRPAYLSCFISYSARDEEFAQSLYSRMREENLRVWFAPEDVKGGQKLHEQIERAIGTYDRLLIVLSSHSIRSQWVETEIRKALSAEAEENRRKLFPIRLVDINTLREWKCFDADSGKDLAIEVREYFIPDFSDWRSPSVFRRAFERLLRDLRREDGMQASVRGAP